MTDVEVLFKQLDKARLLSKSTRLQKLIKVPRGLLVLRIFRLIAILFKKPIRVKAKTFWGEDMLVVFPEVVSLSIFPYGMFEEDVTRMILGHVEPGMTFLDIGAHFGFNTLLASTIVGDTGQVHAFEPTPSTFGMLRSNVKSKKNIYANNLALLSEERIIQFNDYGLEFAAFNSIYDGKQRNSNSKAMKATNYQIKAISVDGYVEKNNIKPDFVKIDAESAEYDILRGMTNTLQSIRPKIIVEVGDTDVTNSKDVGLYLLEKGYRPYEVKDNELVEHKLKDRYGQRGCGNLLFLPE